MRRLNITVVNSPAFWVTGQLDYETRSDGSIKGTFTEREGADILAWTWRALFAEMIASRLEKRHLRLEWAYLAVTRYAVSRAKAYGSKWRKWYVRQRFFIERKD